MDTNRPTKALLLEFIPADHLALIGLEAGRRGWSRVAYIRYLIAQAAERIERAERRRAEKVTA